MLPGKFCLGTKCDEVRDLYSNGVTGCCERGMTLIYYKLTVHRTRGQPSFCQIGEINFFFKGQRVIDAFGEGAMYPDQVQVTSPGYNPGNERPPKIIDGNSESKWLDYGAPSSPDPEENVWTMLNWGYLLFEFPYALAIDYYSLGTGNDNPSRDPIEWTLEASPDNDFYVVLDEIKDATDIYPLEREKETALFNISVPCWAPVASRIANVNDNGTCAEGAIVRGETYCTAQCNPGYVPSIEKLYCLNTYMSPDIYECVPLS